MVEGRAEVRLDDLFKLKLIWTVVNEPTQETVFDSCYAKVQSQFAQIEKNAKILDNVAQTYSQIEADFAGAVGYKDLKNLETTIKSYISDVNANLSEFAEADLEYLSNKIHESEELLSEVTSKMKQIRRAGGAKKEDLDKDDFDFFKELATDGAPKEEEVSKVDVILEDSGPTIETKEEV